MKNKLIYASPYKKSKIKIMFDLLIKVLDMFIALFPNKKHIIKAYIVENFVPDVRVDTMHGPVYFYCPNDISVWRAETLLTKEPDTITWLDSIPKDGIFWDIGANIGVYTLYAAKRGLNVLAFEPVANNYYILNRNILINGLPSSNVHAYCLAFANDSKLSTINLTTDAAASSGSNFGVDHGNVTFRQGMLGISIDEFIERYNVIKPQYIKLDVDGIEFEILKGAAQTLSSDVKEILIELSRSNKEMIEDFMSKIGFSVKSRYSFGEDEENVVFIKNLEL